MYDIGTVHSRTFGVFEGQLVKPQPKTIRHVEDLALNARIDEDYETAVGLLDSFEETMKELTSYDNTVIEFEKKGPYNPSTGTHWKGPVHRRVYDLAPEPGQVVALPSEDGSATTDALSFDPRNLNLDLKRPGTFPSGIHMVDHARWNKHPNSTFSLSQESGNTTIFMEQDINDVYWRDPKTRYNVSLTLSADGREAEYRLEAVSAKDKS